MFCKRLTISSQEPEKEAQKMDDKTLLNVHLLLGLILAHLTVIFPISERMLFSHSHPSVLCP
jgi:hypothetical protein